MSPQLTHHAATALFFFFGARSLYQSVFAWEGGGEELAEVEKELSETKDGKRVAKKRAFGALLHAPHALHAQPSRSEANDTYVSPTWLVGVPRSTRRLTRRCNVQRLLARAAVAGAC